VSLVFVLHRLAYGVVSLAILSAIVFSCTQLLPGDAAVVILGDNATPEALAELRARLGLDRPVHEQFLAWISAAVVGDFGVSTTLNQPVARLMADPFRLSLALTVTTLAVAGLVAIPLGAFAAVRRGTRTDGAILTASYLGISVPDFVIGPLLIIAIAAPPLQLFPSSGYVPLAQSPLGWLQHVALPVATLTIVLVAHLLRQTRSGVLDALASDYIRTARLKGLPERQVLWRHALRNGLTTTVTVLALDIGYLMGSIVIVEEIFAYPGLGRLTVYAVANRDIPLVQGTTLVIGAVYVIANLLADLAHGALNPRIARR
jgi:peptide/nickel transport system permease protein